MELLKRLFWAITRALFVIAIPLAVIATYVTLTSVDPSFYEHSQVNYGAMQTLGLNRQQVQAASKSLADYFASPSGSLVAELQKNGLATDFFSQREIIHLQDVKGLLVGIGMIQKVALSYIVLFLLGSLVLARRGFLQSLGRGLLWGAGLTLVVIVAFGVLSLTDFSGLFLTFHLVSFNNDLWILDPRVDKLISMFPPDFFMEASLTAATYVALESVGLAVLGAVLLAINGRQVAVKTPAATQRVASDSESA